MSRLSLSLLVVVLSFLVAGSVQAQTSNSKSRTDSVSKETLPPDEFIEVDEQPVPIVPIEKLVEYPPEAVKRGLEGKVVVEALVERDGHVSKANVVKYDRQVFKAAALKAVLSEKYYPARLRGTALRIWITQTVNFKLPPKDGE